jgi:hypothetical protein
MDGIANRNMGRVIKDRHSVLLTLSDDIWSREPNGFAVHEDRAFGENEDFHPCLSNQSRRHSYHCLNVGNSS